MNIEISIFDGGSKLVIDKPIRLIELFAGYGSQALALKYLGIPFEHHRISEWAIKSIQAYKDAHFPDDDTDYSAGYSDEFIKDFLDGKISSDYNSPIDSKRLRRMPSQALRTIFSNMMCSHNLGSIVTATGADLGIVDTDKYEYITCYSFPCQDLSNAGLRNGMSRGSGTRSGMLWQVERLLYECRDIGELPQILLMENVPEVVGTKNFESFQDWIKSLDDLGYKSYWKILNATEYGIPQNRRRCFMVSVLGDYYYDFPEPIGCEKRLKDVLEKDVSEEFYLSDETVASFVKWSDRNQANGNGFGFFPKDGTEMGGSVLTKAGSRGCDNYIDTIALSNRDAPKPTERALTLSATDYKVCKTPRHQPVNAVVEKNENN